MASLPNAGFNHWCGPQSTHQMARNASQLPLRQEWWGYARSKAKDWTSRSSGFLPQSCCRREQGRPVRGATGLQSFSLPVWLLFCLASMLEFHACFDSKDYLMFRLECHEFKAAPTLCFHMDGTGPRFSILWLSGKELTCQCRRRGFNPWVGKMEKQIATYSSILGWEIPWTEEPGGLQFTGSQRVGHHLVTKQ